MRYEIRSDTGILIAKISDVFAYKLISLCPGKWGNYRTADGVFSAYTFTESRVGETGTLTVYLWEGYKLIDKGY